MKSYDFTLWLLAKVERFPRSHRFTVGDRLATESLQLLEDLLSASYGRERLPSLDRAQHRLNLLRFLLRLAKDLRLFTVESYGFACDGVDEMGRMAGGWRRSVGTKA